MLAILSATTYDILGVVEIDALPASDFGETRRRVNRVSTLDGGAVVNDGGFTEADRTVTLRWDQGTDAFEASVTRLVAGYQTLTLAIRDGVFSVVPDTYKPGAESSLSLLVTEKLST